MKVNVITSRSGGPFINGRDLVSALNKRGIIANHTHKLKDLLMSPLHQSADVVHVMGLPIVAYRVWRKPVILTIVADHRVEGILAKRFFPKAIQKANILTTTSRFLKVALNLRNATVIPNAIRPRRYALAKHEEKDTIKLVMMTGFHFPEKARGVLNLAEILAKAQKMTEKHIECTVMGGGPYLEEIKSKAERGVEIEFVGFKRDPRKIMEKSDIFVYYSGHDNVPTAILEAMACGLPVVTNEVGAVSEAITNGGDGYVAKNDGEYLTHLLDLLEDFKLRQRLGKSARETVEEKFSLEKVVERYARLYEKVSLPKGEPNQKIRARRSMSLELCPWKFLSEERLREFLNDPINNEGALDRKIVIDYLKEHFDKPRLLDVGCGTGFMYLALRKSGMDFEYLGVDKTEKMVEFARKRFPGANFAVGDIYKLQFPDRSWDVAYCRHIFTHLPRYEGALAEVARVTKDCLIVCLLYPLADKQQIKVEGWPPDQTMPGEFSEHYLNTYARGSFMKTLKSLGFNVVADKVVEVGGYFGKYELIIARRKKD